MITHCTLDYHRFGTSGLDTFSNGVNNGIYSNHGTFATPTINQEDFVHILQKFSTAAADYATYGVVKKTIFTNARKELIDALDLLADYVDSVALGDESMIILAGYTPSITVAQSNAPLVKIDSFTAKRTTNDCEIGVEIPAITNHGTIHYFCICSEGQPLSNPIVIDGQLVLDNTTAKMRYDYTRNRKKLFKNLTAGVTYYFYVFAANTVSVAPLSDAKSVMAA